MTTAIQESRPEYAPGQPGQSWAEFFPSSLRMGVYFSGNTFYTNIAVPLSDEVSILNCVKPLRGGDYPALVKLWDNDVDSIYDTI